MKTPFLHVEVIRNYCRHMTDEVDKLISFSHSSYKLFVMITLACITWMHGVFMVPNPICDRWMVYALIFGDQQHIG
jgi:hypothetical protein